MALFQAQPEGLGPILRLTALSVAHLEQPNYALSALLAEKWGSSSDENKASTDPDIQLKTDIRQLSGECKKRAGKTTIWRRIKKKRHRCK